MEETSAQVSSEQTLKRKRGRPRKSEPPEQQQPPEKRARGRPRKSDISNDVAASVEPSETLATIAETTAPHTHDRPLTSTSDRDSVGIPATAVEKRPRGRPRKYKTKEEYQEAGKQYRRAHKARKSMLAAGTIRLPPAVNGAGDDDETDEDSVLDDDSVIADLPKTSWAAAKPTHSLDAGIDEILEEYESAHEEQPSNQELAQRHESLKHDFAELKKSVHRGMSQTAGAHVEIYSLKERNTEQDDEIATLREEVALLKNHDAEIDTLRKRISEQDEQIATLRGEFASLKNYNIAIIRQREAS